MMKYIEVAKKIKLTRDVSERDVKQELLDKLQLSFDVKNLKEMDHGFQIDVETGSKGQVIKHSLSTLNVNVTKTKDIVRIIIRGNSKVSPSLILWYSALFFLILLLGLLPGSIETSADKSGALDVLVFLVFGIFTFYDIDKKLNEIKNYLETTLESLNVEFG